MEFRILGQLAVVDGDRLVSLPRRRQRALLAVLLLHPGELLATDRLIDDLWGERVPPTAKDALQNYVSQLRKAIGVESIVTRPPGYGLAVAPEQIDLGRFRLLVREARAASDNAARAGKLRDALALWRGQPLADLVYEPFAAVELPLLEDERLAAYKELLDSELELGRHGSIVDEIDSLSARIRTTSACVDSSCSPCTGRAARRTHSRSSATRGRCSSTSSASSRGASCARSSGGSSSRTPRSTSGTGPTEGDAPSRKTVTILFAGLPEPQAGLDPEALHARQQRFTTP